MDEEFKKCLRIHGLCDSGYNDSSSSCESLDFDETYESLKPPPIPIDINEIIVIKAKNCIEEKKQDECGEKLLYSQVAQKKVEKKIQNMENIENIQNNEINSNVHSTKNTSGKIKNRGKIQKNKSKNNFSFHQNPLIDEKTYSNNFPSLLVSPRKKIDDCLRKSMIFSKSSGLEINKHNDFHPVVVPNKTEISDLGANQLNEPDNNLSMYQISLMYQDSNNFASVPVLPMEKSMKANDENLIFFHDSPTSDNCAKKSMLFPKSSKLAFDDHFCPMFTQNKTEKSDIGLQGNFVHFPEFSIENLNDFKTEDNANSGLINDNSTLKDINFAAILKNFDDILMKLQNPVVPHLKNEETVLQPAMKKKKKSKSKKKKLLKTEASENFQLEYLLDFREKLENERILKGTDNELNQVKSLKGLVNPDIENEENDNENYTKNIKIQHEPLNNLYLGYGYRNENLTKFLAFQTKYLNFSFTEEEKENCVAIKNNQGEIEEMKIIYFYSYGHRSDNFLDFQKKYLNFPSHYLEKTVKKITENSDKDTSEIFYLKNGIKIRDLCLASNNFQDTKVEHTTNFNTCKSNVNVVKFKGEKLNFPFFSLETTLNNFEDKYLYLILLLASKTNFHTKENVENFKHFLPFQKKYLSFPLHYLEINSATEIIDNDKSPVITQNALRPNELGNLEYDFQVKYLNWPKTEFVKEANLPEKAVKKKRKRSNRNKKIKEINELKIETTELDRNQINNFDVENNDENRTNQIAVSPLSNVFFNGLLQHFNCDIASLSIRLICLFIFKPIISGFLQLFAHYISLFLDQLILITFVVLWIKVLVLLSN